ncbi:MAG TPA: T9SS type A sorting domain-containing protein [Hanamia sp.]|nr:T9SS type A sorting domain-containing protein [Hanamia sp.]
MKKTFTLIILFLCFTSIRAQVPNCATNVSPANASTNVSPTPYITLKWNPVPGAVLYNVYLDAKLPPTTLVGTVLTDSLNFYNAAYSTIYYWYVVPVNSSGSAIGCGVNTTSFITTPPPPAPINDDCVGAVDISSYPSTGSTLGATQSQPADPCGGFTGSADDDVWYTFNTLYTGSVAVTLNCQSGFDGVLEVFKGTCGSFSYVGCSDASGVGGTETVNINALVGTTYKVRVYSFGPNLSDRGGFTISATGSALPISLLGFKGEHIGSNNVLSWSTATELNNQGFEVQYSFNGSDFRKLAFVNSKVNSGNSSSILNYQYTDTKAIGGNEYYRLMQVDKDGMLNYSNVVLIKGNKINALSLNAVYPNPAKDKLNLIISSPVNNNINVIITDLAGKIVRRQAFSILNGGNNLDFDVSTLPAGSYFIKAICANGCQTAVNKFVKE